MLSTQQLNRIQDVFRARMAMRPIAVSHDALQQPARRTQIFMLRRTDRYFLVPLVSGAPVPPADGVFLYVILADDPGCVLCAAPQGSEVGRDARFGVHGHTSISLRADVLYAGGLEFEGGELRRWTNGSGHYAPHARLHPVNLIPAVRLLLPPDRFTDIAQMDAAQTREQLTLRGYAVMG